MTEDEAKTKWCPFVRAVHAGAAVQPIGTFVPVVNRLFQPQAFPDHACIGSACMSWRETAPAEDKVEKRQEFRPPGEYNPPFSNCPEGWEVDMYGVSDTYTVRRVVGKYPAQGFCGLAGRP